MVASFPSFQTLNSTTPSLKKYWYRLSWWTCNYFRLPRRCNNLFPIIIWILDLVENWVDSLILLKILLDCWTLVALRVPLLNEIQSLKPTHLLDSKQISDWNQPWRNGKMSRCRDWNLETSKFTNFKFRPQTTVHLCECKQRKSTNMDTGVPKGCVLGPILFINHANDTVKGTIIFQPWLFIFHVKSIQSFTIRLWFVLFLF